MLEVLTQTWPGYKKNLAAGNKLDWQRGPSLWTAYFCCIRNPALTHSFQLTISTGLPGSDILLYRRQRDKETSHCQVGSCGTVKHSNMQKLGLLSSTEASRESVNKMKLHALLSIIRRWISFHWAKMLAYFFKPFILRFCDETHRRDFEMQVIFFHSLHTLHSVEMTLLTSRWSHVPTKQDRWPASKPIKHD